MQFPGWTNAWTMPIKTRVDMLTTGVRTPIGHQGVRHRPQRDRAGRRLARARSWRRSRARAACSTSATSAGSTSTSSPSPTSWRATGCASPTSSGHRERDRRHADRHDRRGRTASRSTCAIRGLAAIWSRSRCSSDGGGAMRQRHADGDAGALGAAVAVRPTGAWAPRHRRMAGWRRDARGGPTTMPAHGRAVGLPPMRRPARRLRARAAARPSFRSARSPTSRSPAARPWSATRRACWSATSTSTSTRAQRDIGGYVNEAKEVVAQARRRRRARSCRRATYLKWTGQYEQLAEMLARMKLVVPLTLLIIVLLLFLQFRNVIEVLIVLLSIPFALVGSVWLHVAARLPALDGGLGRHHRARRARGADRHRDDRLHRPRLRAAPGRRAASTTSTTSSPRTWRARSSACGPSS